MSRRHPIAVPSLVALYCVASLSYLAAIRWRDQVMPRRDPERPFRDLYLVTEDGTGIAAREIKGGRMGAVVLAHPAVTGQRYAPLVGLAEKLSPFFDVYTFDFRGHGKSGGRLKMELDGPVEDLRVVVRQARDTGDQWVGLIGFSLGGMASYLYTACYDDIDAVAAVSAPLRLPDIARYRRWLPAWSFFLRFLGARFEPAGGGGATPLDVADDFPAVPLLIIHAEREAFYSRDDLDEMLRKLKGKAEFWEIEGAGHTELAGREDDLIGWMIDQAESPSG